MEYKKCIPNKKHTEQGNDLLIKSDFNLLSLYTQNYSSMNKRLKARERRKIIKLFIKHIPKIIEDARRQLELSRTQVR